MISTRMAIERFRRDLLLGTVVRVMLMVAAALVLVGGSIVPTGLGGGILLGGLVALWMLLGYRSQRGAQLTANSPILIATGQFEEAEKQIALALGTFSLFKSPKLLSLHHLAVLRHAQGRFAESAELCHTLLGQKLGGLSGIAKPSRLILTDALLELSDVRGAYAAMGDLYLQRLNLPEAVNLMLLQLDYSSRIGAWKEMMQNVQSKAELSELLPGELSVRAQAMLALAAKKTGQEDWAQWLKRRVELMGDVAKVVRERPVVGEVWG
jgi:hypothetical protein